MKNSSALVILLFILAPFSGFSQVVLSGSSGGDMGARINQAVASLPPNGGSIKLEPLASGQCYSFVTPIVFTEPVILEGEGPGTCLSFNGSGAAITFYNNKASFTPRHGYGDGFGLRDVTLMGSGPEAGQTGVALGGAVESVGFYAMGLNIDSFGTGLQFEKGVWNFKMEHSSFGQNRQSVLWPSDLHYGGENIEFDSVTFVGADFVNSIEFNDSSSDFSNLMNLTFISCNFDDAQLVINNGSGAVRLYSPHFENPAHLSGDEPFLRISAYTAATDVLVDGPDFYNDQTNPYPSSFVEIDGGPVVTISQMRSVNLDGSTNVPANMVVNGDATVTLLGDAPLRAAQAQYIVKSGNPRMWVMGGIDASSTINSNGPMMYSQNHGSDSQSPVVQIGGTGYNPTIGFNLWTGSGNSYYGAQIREGGPNELDFCSNGANTITGGTYVCKAAVVNGVFKSMAPDGTPPFIVSSHTPPTNLNAWPATFTPSGIQIKNPHITTAKIILPNAGATWVPFSDAGAFTAPPQCTVSYQTTSKPGAMQTLSFNSAANGISIFGQPYVGVYFICVGN